MAKNNNNYRQTSDQTLEHDFNTNTAVAETPVKEVETSVISSDNTIITGTVPTIVVPSTTITDEQIAAVRAAGLSDLADNLQLQQAAARERESLMSQQAKRLLAADILAQKLQQEQLERQTLATFVSAWGSSELSVRKDDKKQVVYLLDADGNKIPAKDTITGKIIPDTFLPELVPAEKFGAFWTNDTGFGLHLRTCERDGIATTYVAKEAGFGYKVSGYHSVSTGLEHTKMLCQALKKFGFEVEPKQYQPDNSDLV